MSSPGDKRLRVSVAMCTYNGEKYLRKQLESIQSQQLSISELVICDDGSVDGTHGIIEEFSQRAGFPVHFIKNDERLGSSKNFERAISLCCGDLIALADQDDVWFSHKTEMMVAAFEQEPQIGGIFTDALVIDPACEQTGDSLWSKYGYSARERSLLASGEYAPVLLRRPVVTGATLMFRSALRSAVLPIPSPWIHDAWLSWTLAMHSRLVHLEQPLMAYRAHPAQQIGVPPGIMSHLRHVRTIIFKGFGSLSGSKSRTLREYQNHVCELRQLLNEVEQMPVPDQILLSCVSGKAAFCEDVLRSFQKTRGARLWFWLLHLVDYQRFSLMGWRTGLRDALL